ncbi:MAG: hypothetical protein ABF483_10430 [Liquorilactobacillus nagelii]|jgi:hypothetical membrane protein|uniref:hypothetical protein n=1 Tax=Liquorilactobacillus TaxID=2767888 RepID=UPI0006F00533|nr:hypothetical protein [Liquorilactobacillus nagelii]KRL40125.1 hypothetical protein FD45_GL000029 [Liquorilactobacillus nagelii DSM 13675]MCI1922409.1 hypothetical protein [Liquorilactobacillus nagelii]MCI1976355.1 hypothetical protein [Liquorilactobacillus nagelii]MCP9314749.1 hypothetical protein [Liquorilactobacillus nagelii]QYH54117.1 hypothetical protein G6O73_05210 [Liquorilactobacillus nagelii DSM 13675]
MLSSGILEIVIGVLLLMSSFLVKRKNAEKKIDFLYVIGGLIIVLIGIKDLIW